MAENRPRHVAVYVRVSSKDQKTASQEPDLERWLAAYAADTDVYWYRDKFTGRVMERPGWTELERQIASGSVSKIVCWRLDRLGRTASGLTALFDRLNELKIGLVSVREGFDLTTPGGRLLANIMASVAAYETEVRLERVVAGIEAARAKGKRWGGSKRGRILRRTKKKRTMIAELRKLGYSIRDIAAAVDLSAWSVAKTLKEEAAACE